MSHYNNIFGNGRNWATVQGFVAPKITEKELIAYDVLTYGATNSYPQEVEYALSRSSIASACVQTLCEFLYGDGFAEQFTADAVVNDKGQTLNEVLYLACQQLAKFNGFALLLNANVLGEYTSIECFPFEYVRLGVPTDGVVDHVRVWDNWAYESPRQGANLGEVESINLFNPATVAEEISQCKHYSDYKGQVLYFTMNDGFYPASTFDSAFEQVLATGNIPAFTNNYIRNGFSSSALIARKDVIDDEERKRMYMNFESISGVRNAGNIALVEGDFALLDISSTQNLDKQYVEIHAKLKEDVRECFQQPSILHGSSRQGGFPNQEEMIHGYTYYNAKTRMYRKMLSKQFSEIGANFVYDIGSDFSIKETQFL